MMRTHSATLIYAIVGIVALAAIPRQGNAQTYLYKKVADTNTPRPTEWHSDLFRRFSAPTLDGGRVAFQAFGKSSSQGVYTDLGGSLREVFHNNELVLDYNRTFNSFSIPQIAGDSVIFPGSLNVSGAIPSHGIYRWDSGSDQLSIVADDATFDPKYDTSRIQRIWGADVSEGNVAFTGTIRPDGSSDAIYLHNEATGSLSLAAERLSQAPTPEVTHDETVFGGFSVPTLDGTNMAFRAQTHNGIDYQNQKDGIWTSVDGTMDVVAFEGQTSMPGTSKTFLEFGGPAFESGTVAFYGSGGVERGVYTNASATGDLVAVADLNTSIPGGTGTYTFFNSNVAMDGGVVAFRAAGENGQQGIYRYDTQTQQLGAVIDRNVTLDGKVISQLQFTGDSAWDNSQAAFLADFSDGSEGIFVATPLDSMTITVEDINGSSGVSIGEGDTLDLTGTSLTGWVNVNAGAELTLRDTVSLLGSLTVDGALLGDLTVEEGGLLTGNGTFNGVLINDGTFNVGASPGVAQLTDFINTGTLDVEIAGLSDGNLDPALTEYDIYTYTNSMTLGGVLRLSLLDGFAPSRRRLL